MGCINIYNVESGDSEIENKIIREVASYGRQLGWIIEVLDLVLKRLTVNDLRENDLTEEERATLQQFSELIRRIEEVKGASRPHKVTPENIDRVINDIRAWKEKDEITYRKIVSRIKDAFLSE